MKALLLTLTFALAASTAMARPVARKKPSVLIASLTCDDVRSFVGQYGVVKATELARSYGMSGSQERQARRCLARRE